MRSIRADERSVAIWFSGEAPPERGELLALVRRSLREEGYAPWPDTEAECFAAGEETLVIARPGEARPRAFRFPDLEALLAGAALLPAEAGALYAGERGYLLVLAPEDGAPAGLCEFGEEIALSPLWESFAREHGRCLLPAGAAGALRDAFRQE